MDCRKMLFLIVVISLVESLEASYYKNAQSLVIQSSAYIKGLSSKVKSNLAEKLQRKSIHHGIESNSTAEQIFHDPSHKPSVMQATKNEGDVTSQSTGGLINISKTHNNPTYNVTFNHNYYAPKKWHETFAGWINNGTQARAVGLGFVLGGISGYGLHAIIMSSQQEKKTEPRIER